MTWERPKQVLVKSASATKRFDMDFSNRLLSGEVVATVDAFAVTKDEAAGGVDLGDADEITINGFTSDEQKAQLELAGGTAGVQYLVSITVTGDQSTSLTGEGYLYVE